MKDEIRNILTMTESDRQSTFVEKVNFILSRATNLFELNTGILSRIIENDYHIIQLYSPDASCLKKGDQFELSSTYCMLVTNLRQTIGFSDIQNTEWTDHPAYLKFKLKCYYGTPILVNNAIYGTLNFTSSDAKDGAQTNEIIEAINNLGQWISHQLSTNPQSKHLCSELCDNFSELCSDPLKWCEPKHSQTKFEVKK